MPGVDAPTHRGEGVEGYFAPAETAALAAKLERAGGALAYIAMDEPLWFGHYYHEKNACHSSIDNVVARVAANMREYQKAFPNVIIGDIEPFRLSPRSWAGRAITKMDADLQRRDREAVVVHVRRYQLGLQGVAR